MDWLLRLVTPRNFILVALVLGGIQAWIYFGTVPRRMYRQWRYPPEKQAADPDISELLKRREELKVEAFYRKVSALIEEARGEGFSVDGLQAKANAALDLERAGFRDAAMRTLAAVELEIPRKEVQYIPMEPQAPDTGLESPDLLPSQLPARQAGARTAKSKRKAARRKPARRGRHRSSRR